MRAHSLRRRMVAACILVALLAALCFSALGLMFVYVVEDSFFDNMLEQEVAHQQRTQGRGAPLLPFVSAHRSSATFPPDLAPDARRGEYWGQQGRHYHVRTVALEQGQVYLVAEVSRELVVRPKLRLILTWFGAATLAILAITAGTGYWLASRAAQPLLRLTQLVSGALPGQLPRGFSAAFPDNEIGALARTLDGAMDRISGFIAREQHFTRDASHELRTPLTAIDGAAQLLARQALTPQALAQVQRIRQACAQMTQCVDTLLALAREELGTAHPVPVALLPLIERAVVDHAHLLEGKQVEVVVEVAPDAQLPAPHSALAILLNNLISNAFTHTDSGVVHVSYAHGALVVADSGPGIPAHLQGSVFEPGVKGAASSGYGLGLSIASRLAARCNLTLALENGAAGGTRACLRAL